MLLVCPVSKDSLVTLVVLALPDHLVNLEPLVLKDRRVIKVVKVPSARLDNLDLKVHPVIVVCPVCLVLLVLPELVDNEDRL